jgi:two-component system cell cycle sensor histidine kinase/response regulator CckA
MEKHNSCVNSLAIIEYIREKKPERLGELFEDLDLEKEGIRDPKSFLSDPNNWISSSLLIRLYDKAKKILNDAGAAYSIGYNSVLKKRLGYIQKIILFAVGNPARALKDLKRMNAHFNKTKEIELVNVTREGAEVRLLWSKDIPLTRDFCLMNKGIYQAVPGIWGLPPARLTETKCFFEGDDYCEYHLQWEGRSWIRDLFRHVCPPRSVVDATILELEKDKEVLRERYNQIHHLNLDLQHKVEQLTTLQETSTAVLSTLKLEELLDLILTRLLAVAQLDRAGIFLLDENSENLVFIHAVGLEPSLLAYFKGYQIPLKKVDNIIARTARENKPIIVRDVDRMPLNPENPLLLKLNPKAFILVPMTVRGRVVGIMMGDNRGDGRLVADLDGNFLTSFANHIAMALENATLYQKLRESERKYREIVENVSEGIWVLDGDGTVVFSNRRLGEMLGYEDLIGVNVYKLVEADGGRQMLVRVLMDNMKGKTAKEEVLLKGKGGEAISALISSVPIMKGNQYSGCLSMVTDLTEKKRIESRLLQAQKLESVGTMAGGIAHDFNNILTGILGYAALLKQKIDGSSDSGRYVEIIERSGLRASELVRKLLTFSRGSEKEGIVGVAAVGETVGETMELVHGSLPKNINVDISIKDDLPLIGCDPTQLQQVILNICLNARDAMPDGGSLSVMAEETDYAAMRAARPCIEASPGRYVLISISDTGTGILPENRERIFDPFFTTKEVGKGSGLGLAVVYGVVKGCGGCIRLESEVGKGTTFKLYFPVATSPGEQAEETSQVQTVSGSESILVVDDEEIVKNLAKEVLSLHGYRVMAARDGLEAVDLYRAFGKDIGLVLLDLVMPGLSGLETYKKLKAIDPEVRVLFCSGEDPGHSAAEEVRALGLPLVRKPFQLDALAKKVRDVLDAGMDPPHLEGADRAARSLEG